MSDGVIAEIVQLQVNKVIERMQQQHQIAMTFSPRAQMQLAKAAGTMEIGGRRIEHHIERHILLVLSNYWLEGMQSGRLANKIELDWNAEENYCLKEIETIR